MKKILITGATGFIGGRLAEIAVELGVSVWTLVRTWSRAALLSRLPVQMVHGDILDLDSLRNAMEGCDAVFHCAVDNRVTGDAHRRSSVQGTANVMQVALEMNVERVIHLSSIAVYSYRLGRDSATEDGSYRYSGDAYCDGKIDGEKIALRYYRERGLPVTVLRPTIVYGPFGLWTSRTVQAIREGRMVLIDHGMGVCNSLYVDNLVEAMLLAAEHDGAAGEAFHISDAVPVSWKQFIEGHARALGDSCLPLPAMTAREIAAARAEMRNHRPSSLKQTMRFLRDPHVREALRSIPVVDQSVRAARMLLPESARHMLRQKLLNSSGMSARDGSAQAPSRPLPSQTQVDIQTGDVVVSIEKARRMLGYNPKISFAEGMEITAAWINWARL